MPNQGGFHEKHVQAGQQSHKNETLSAKLPAKKIGRKASAARRAISPMTANMPLKPAARVASTRPKIIEPATANGGGLFL
jgi:hypothetical protein